MLRRIKNLIKRNSSKTNAANIKQDTEKFILAWVPCDDPPAGSICIRRDDPCLQGMIDPLAYPDQQHSPKEKECVFICHALKIEHQCRDHANAPEYYEYVIPVFYLKRGQKFIHLTPVEVP